MPDYSIPYYSGPQLPQDFHDWLDTMPEAYEWIANELGKEQSTYTFYKKERPVTIELSKIKKFTSKIDGCEFDYCINQSTSSHYKILSYRIEGTDWQDFIPNDKRAYSPEQYQEMMNLLEGKVEGTLEGRFIPNFHD